MSEKHSEGDLEPIQLEQRINLIRNGKALGRRKFLKSVSLAGVGVAASSLLNGCLGSTSVNGQNITQSDVLNFALNLEYLEAEFYNRAVTRNFLDSSVLGGPSKAQGGGKVPFADPRVADIATEINSDEIAHVKFLRRALGSVAVAEPPINLSALGFGFATDAEFLNLARAFEDTGVSAYAGAATVLTGDNLQTAAQILATEAYHAGSIRLEVVQKAIVAFRTDSLDQVPAENQFFVTDPNGLAIKRTPSQVLAIVYANGSPGTSTGGFFPSGVNGNLHTV